MPRRCNTSLLYRLVFDIALDPGETWHTYINFIALVDGEELMPKHTDAALDAIRAADGAIAPNLNSSDTIVSQ